MTKLDKFREDSLVCEWMDNLNAAANTEDAYTLSLREYTLFIGMSPEEIINEAEDEMRLGVLPRHRKIKKHLIAFRKHLQEKGLSDFTIRGRMTGVRSFYNSFEIELPKIQGDRRKARTLEENNAIPTKEDLQTVLTICDPLEKAIMLIGISSGLASNEIRNIKVKQFLNGYDPDTKITTLRLIRKKTNVELVTFLSPEASNAVLEYLRFRDREAKAATPTRIRQLSKQKIINNNGYLFILRQVPDSFVITGDEEIRKLSENALQKLYRALADKSKKSTSFNIYSFIRSHTMRKYFNSALLNAGADSFFVEYLMGHALDDTRAAYFRASPEKLKEIYKKYIPYLTIQKELDLSESPEYQAIKSENDILRAETAKHVVERQEIIALKNEVVQGTIERAELNALKSEIESLYREMRGTQEGFKLGNRLVRKIHPNRLILQPDDGKEIDPDM
ncbi:MAG TPA: tyrosine-type recombinase/integrase [Methanosarcina sp.]|jgi:integrase